MALYFINYDLRSTGHDYRRFHDALKVMGAQQALRSGWFVESNQPIRSLSDQLLSCMSPSDGLFIVEMASSATWAATRLLDNAGPWLKGVRP